MNLTHAQLTALAAASGHHLEPLEKVLRLIDLLNALRAHPFLGPRLALKGGTALNLFIFDLPRLSVDIDLNYIGAADRETMLAERSLLEKALRAVCARQRLDVDVEATRPENLAWRLAYTRSNGQRGKLKLDLNFLLRVPLWPTQRMDSWDVGGYRAESITVLDTYELAAGKLAAAFSREKSRDLFDLRALLAPDNLDVKRLRLGFVAYGGMNRIDWRSIAVDKLSTTAADIQKELIPMLRKNLAPTPSARGKWTAELVDNCRALASSLLPLSAEEHDFLTLLNERGELQPDILTPDPQMQGRLAVHPMLLWKQANVRHYRGALDERR
jgi:predicted nucleotidyltransferase component of viral defense system